MGKKYQLDVLQNGSRSSRIVFDGNKWTVSLPNGLNPQECQARIKKELEKWYRLQAKEILGGRLFHYSRLMNAEPKRIVIKSQKRLWGSCNYRTQAIHLNWKIILSPLEVIDYVVVHELCHLFVPNHSKRFWTKVAKFIPDFKEQQKWLRTNFLDMSLL